MSFGLASDVPASADFDGDGHADIALWRPHSGIWYVTKSSDGGLLEFQHGTVGDMPVPKDFDGDGKADPTVWRSSSRSFYSISSSSGELRVIPMQVTGEPVPGDYDGDGKTDFAIRHGSTWSILESGTDVIRSIRWQRPADIAVQHDYDGDGSVDLATWRPSNGLWLIKNSSDGTLRTEHWGIAGDQPLPALYRR